MHKESEELEEEGRTLKSDHVFQLMCDICSHVTWPYVAGRSHSTKRRQSCIGACALQEWIRTQNESTFNCLYTPTKPVNEMCYMMQLAEVKSA